MVTLSTEVGPIGWMIRDAEDGRCSTCTFAFGEFQSDMLMDVNYKEAKESFVSDTTGSTVGHVNLISSVALVSSSWVVCA